MGTNEAGRLLLIMESVEEYAMSIEQNAVRLHTKLTRWGAGDCGMKGIPTVGQGRQ